MKRMNRKERKEQRRIEAKERQAASDALTPEEKIEKAREERRPLSGEEDWKLYGL